MDTEEMLQEVDRRVAEGFVEHLLPRAVNHHAAKSRRHYKECDCNYCKMKVDATRDIAWLNFPSDYNPKNHISIWDSDYEFWEIRGLRRKGLRDHYREKLKELMYE